ncbi:MAG: hypothetical protein FWC71_10385 [Defluviitaleaceae bacterium]|nr:hypothetical protein [Defluviitaleaceae bacterium]
MKFRLVPLLLVLIVAAFFAGQYIGASGEFARNRALEAEREVVQTTIAVVNADTGIANNGTNQNFSAAIIDTLGDEFVLVSPSMAQMGFLTGLYGAVITFPSHVSQRILSFNANNPEQVRLEFQINPMLTEQDFIYVHSRILNLQLAINTSLAYTYVSSIFEQFHDAQDQINRVFLNDQAHLSALQRVHMETFSPLLQLGALPHVPLVPNPPETAHIFADMVHFVDTVSNLFMSSHMNATHDYMDMRETLISMTMNFSNQEDEWMAQLRDWSELFTAFGDELWEYSFYIRDRQFDLMSWSNRAYLWDDSLAFFQEGLLAWYVMVLDWSEGLDTHQGSMDDWRNVIETQIGQIVDYHQIITVWMQNALVWLDEIEAHNEDMHDWHIITAIFHDDLSLSRADLHFWMSALLEWFEESEDWYDAAVDFTTELNVFAQYMNDYFYEVMQANEDVVNALMDWYDLQYTRIAGILVVINSYNEYVDNLHAVQAGLTYWYEALTDFTFMLSTSAAAIEVILEAIPPPPSPAGIDVVLDMQLMNQWHADVTNLWNNLNNELENIDLTVPTQPPDMPPISTIDLSVFDDWGGVTSPPAIDIQLRHIELDLEDVAFYAPEQPPPDYTGADIPNPIAEPPLFIIGSLFDLPEPNLRTPQDTPLFFGTQPLIFDVPIFHVPGDIVAIDAVKPGAPLERAPPRPDDFWSSLGSVHRQLLTFDISNYLTPAYRAAVQRMIWKYENYLHTARHDLSTQINTNIHMMHDVRFAYNAFLTDLRTETLQTEADTIERLNNTLGIFNDIVLETSNDTVSRLSTFSQMMPESRTPLGLNSALAQFTVAPFEFITPDAREAITQLPALDDALATHERRIWTILAILMVVVFITVGSYVYGMVRKKEVTA